MSIIKLNREIVAKCPKCKNDLWFVLVDKPYIEAISGLQCSKCDELIKINIITEEDK